MATQWLRRTWLLATCASALLLAACGGGNIASQFSPSRLVAFGDAMADLGQNGARYTVNDGSRNNWTQYVADQYGLSLEPSSAGGLSYASGNARVKEEPDAGGSTATPTVTEQIDAFLAAGGPADGDLLLISAGTSDVIVQVQAVLDGRQTEAEMLDKLGAAGTELAAQVRRLLDAGAQHIALVGTHNLARTPWGEQTGRQSLMEEASQRLNDQLVVGLVDFGDRLRYIDAALFFNVAFSSPASYGMTDSTTLACNSVDPGQGIGTGTGEVNSNLCTTATLAPGVSYANWLFADRVYPTPQGHRQFGEYAYNAIHERW